MCFIMNKFEHVLGGKGTGRGYSCTVRSKLNKFEHVGVGCLYDEVQYIMGNGHIGRGGVPPMKRQTRLKTLPSHNFVGRW